MSELIKIRVLKKCAIDARYIWRCDDGCCQIDEYITFDLYEGECHNLELTIYSFMETDYIIEGEFIGDDEPIIIKKHVLLDAIDNGLIEIIDGH